MIASRRTKYSIISVAGLASRVPFTASNVWKYPRAGDRPTVNTCWTLTFLPSLHPAIHLLPPIKGHLQRAPINTEWRCDKKKLGKEIRTKGESKYVTKINSRSETHSELHTTKAYLAVRKYSKLDFELSGGQSEASQTVVTVILNSGCSLESLERGRRAF